MFCFSFLAIDLAVLGVICDLHLKLQFSSKDLFLITAKILKHFSL